jgi:hypothetical protein
MAFFLSTQYLGAWLHLPPRSSYFIVLGIPLLAFIGYGVLISAAEGRKPVEVLPHTGMIAEISVGALLGFFMLCAVTALLWTLGLYHVQPNHWQHIFDSFVFNSYLSGMMEELMFRAILLRILGRAFGLRWGLVLSAGLFGIAHLSHGSWLAAVEITINAGLTMGLVYMATGRLWMSIGLHTAWISPKIPCWASTITTVCSKACRSPANPTYLPGGKFGPDASVLATFIGALAVAAIVY